MGGRYLGMNVLPRLQRLGRKGPLLATAHGQADGVHSRVRQHIPVPSIRPHLVRLFQLRSCPLVEGDDWITERDDPKTRNLLEQSTPAETTVPQANHRDANLLHRGCSSFRLSEWNGIPITGTIAEVAGRVKPPLSAADWSIRTAYEEVRLVR